MNKASNRLSPPVFPESVIERPEVNGAIDAAMKKDIVYIHAPAGFGKTVAMTMWLSKRQMPAAWIPLTVYDDDPAIFCRYLLSSLAEFDDSAAKSAKKALDDPGFTGAPFEYFFKVVSSISCDNTRAIIVMDDFHLIENTVILNALPNVFGKLSQVHKLAILSRLDPPVSISAMAIKDQIGELNENSLRFTRKQILHLYKRSGITLSLDEAADIEKKTGGWALGLGAELLSAKTCTSGSFMSQASSEKYIFGYLKNEIWDKWDSNTRNFLLRTSILEDLPPELCDRLCNCNSKNFLSDLMEKAASLYVCLTVLSVIIIFCGIFCVGRQRSRSLT
jgi:LuxR family maltose regulon positive regulatory protein